MVIAPRPIVLHRGFGRNVGMESYLANHGWTILAYVADVNQDRSARTDGPPHIDYTTWREELRKMPSIVTAIDPIIRRKLVERLEADGGFIADLNPTGSAISRKARFGAGTFVDEGVAFVGTLTTVGRCTIIMTPTSIGHDTEIGDFVTIYPSAAISGHVVIEDTVSVGAGAVIVNGRADKPLRIGRGANLVPSAVVTTSVSPGAYLSGNPARPLPPSMSRG